MLAAMVAALGESHASVGIAYGNRAVVLEKQGKLEEALLRDGILQSEHSFPESQRLSMLTKLKWVTILLRSRQRILEVCCTPVPLSLPWSDCWIRIEPVFVRWPW